MQLTDWQYREPRVDKHSSKQANMRTVSIKIILPQAVNTTSIGTDKPELLLLLFCQLGAGL
jgi:hypothetical protein